MKNLVIASLVLSSVLLSGCASSDRPTGAKEIEMSYSRLKLMDLDQMTEMMQQKVRAYKKTGNIEALQQGVEICLSRPDEDVMVEKVLPTVKNPLDDVNAWESTIDALVDKSIANMKVQGVHPSDQVTASVVLENIISEFKPDFIKQYESPGFEARVIERIALADLEFSKAAQSERKLSLMKVTSPPSSIAKRLIEQRNDYLKKKKKEKK